MSQFTLYHYNQDHLGNIREVVNANGTVQQVTNYYPFGAPFSESASVMNADFQEYKNTSTTARNLTRCTV